MTDFFQDKDNFCDKPIPNNAEFTFTEKKNCEKEFIFFSFLNSLYLLYDPHRCICSCICKIS